MQAAGRWPAGRRRQPPARPRPPGSSRPRARFPPPARAPGRPWGTLGKEPGARRRAPVFARTVAHGRPRGGACAHAGHLNGGAAHHGRALPRPLVQLLEPAVTVRGSHHARTIRATRKAFCRPCSSRPAGAPRACSQRLCTAPVACVPSFHSACCVRWKQEVGGPQALATRLSRFVATCFSLSYPSSECERLPLDALCKRAAPAPRAAGRRPSSFIGRGRGLQQRTGHRPRPCAGERRSPRRSTARLERRSATRRALRGSPAAALRQSAAPRPLAGGRCVTRGPEPCPALRGSRRRWRCRRRAASPASPPRTRSPTATRTPAPGPRACPRARASTPGPTAARMRAPGRRAARAPPPRARPARAPAAGPGRRGARARRPARSTASARTRGRTARRTAASGRRAACTASARSRAPTARRTRRDPAAARQRQPGPQARARG